MLKDKIHHQEVMDKLESLQLIEDYEESFKLP